MKTWRGSTSIIKASGSDMGVEMEAVYPGVVTTVKLAG